MKVLEVLDDNNDRFAYKIEELERYTGPPMEIKINSVKDIFRPPHKLGEKEWAFVGEQCEKLEKELGIYREIFSVTLCVGHGSSKKKKTKMANIQIFENAGIIDHST